MGSTQRRRERRYGSCFVNTSQRQYLRRDHEVNVVRFEPIQSWVWWLGEHGATRAVKVNRVLGRSSGNVERPRALLSSGYLGLSEQAPPQPLTAVLGADIPLFELTLLTFSTKRTGINCCDANRLVVVEHSDKSATTPETGDGHSALCSICSGGQPRL